MFDAIYNCANNAVSSSLPRFKHGNLVNLRSRGDSGMSSIIRKDNCSVEEKKEHNEDGKKYPLHEKTKNFLLKGTTINLMKSSNAN